MPRLTFKLLLTLVLVLTTANVMAAPSRSRHERRSSLVWLLSSFHMRLDKRTLDGIRPTTVYASPTVAGDHLFITDEKGFTVVLKGGAPPQVVATHQGWPTRSSPAFVGGKVFLRTEDGVVAAGK